jgi:hypothetical protein
MCAEFVSSDVVLVSDSLNTFSPVSDHPNHFVTNLPFQIFIFLKIFIKHGLFCTFFQKQSQYTSSDSTGF